MSLAAICRLTYGMVKRSPDLDFPFYAHRTRDRSGHRQHHFHLDPGGKTPPGSAAEGPQARPFTRAHHAHPAADEPDVDHGPDEAVVYVDSAGSRNIRARSGSVDRWAFSDLEECARSA